MLNRLKRVQELERSLRTVDDSHNRNGSRATLPVFFDEGQLAKCNSQTTCTFDVQTNSESRMKRKNSV
jgi:hypothetical protein